MSSYTLWTLIKRHRGQLLVTVSAIALRSDVHTQPGDYLTEDSPSLDQAKAAGIRMAGELSNAIHRRGDEVISQDTTIDSEAEFRVRD
jgi:hypothetical protein